MLADSGVAAPSCSSWCGEPVETSCSSAVNWCLSLDQPTLHSMGWSCLQFCLETRWARSGWLGPGLGDMPLGWSDCASFDDELRLGWGFSRSRACKRRCLIRRWAISSEVSLCQGLAWWCFCCSANCCEKGESSWLKHSAEHASTYSDPVSGSERPVLHRSCVEFHFVKTWVAKSDLECCLWLGSYQCRSLVLWIRSSCSAWSLESLRTWKNPRRFSSRADRSSCFILKV